MLAGCRVEGRLGRTGPGRGRAAGQGTTVTVPNWRKWWSKLNAVVFPDSSMTTLLVQSVKLQSLSACAEDVPGLGDLAPSQVVQIRNVFGQQERPEGAGPRVLFPSPQERQHFVQHI